MNKLFSLSPHYNNSSRFTSNDEKYQRLLDHRVSKSQLNNQLKQLFTLSYNKVFVRNLHPKSIKQKTSQLKWEILNQSQLSQNRVYLQKQAFTNHQKKKPIEIFRKIFASHSQKYDQQQNISERVVSPFKSLTKSYISIDSNHQKLKNRRAFSNQIHSQEKSCINKTLKSKFDEEINTILLIKSMPVASKNTKKDCTSSFSQKISTIQLSLAKSKFFQESKTSFEPRKMLTTPKTNQSNGKSQRNSSARTNLETNYITSHNLKLLSEIQDYGPWDL